MILPLATAAAVQPDEVRLAVVVSSNHGLPGEEPLKYADRDAERVAELLRTLGRYGAGDVWVVPSADTADLFATLARVTVRAQEVANGGGSASLLVFYAGHAGVDGLHLGGEVLPLPDLKSAIRVVPAADRIVVLDACNAGTIARSRGAALVDVRDQPVGFAPPEDEAWMASSGPEERSFEVEDRRGALFTHFFLSGARGAADLDADQRVTLGELYGFVQVHTAEAAAGLGQLQQPRWAGVLGDFALTDLSASATGVRVVGPVADPLLVIDERAQEVVAEVPRGGGANLALPPGSYQMVAVRDDGVSLGRLAVPADGWTLWTPAQELGRASSVRTRGGFYDTTPWGASLGYELGLGTAPGRFDAHGGHLSLHRALGGGHALAIGVGGAFVPTTTQGWVGSERRGELS
ncbi:MAG: caspase family protein, partial [Myxococcota bacterium]